MRNPNTSQDIDLKIHFREILRRQESRHIKAGNKNITNLKTLIYLYKVDLIPCKFAFGLVSFLNLGTSHYMYIINIVSFMYSYYFKTYCLPEIKLPTSIGS